MRKQRARLTQELKTKIEQKIIAGEKLETVAAMFDVSLITVTRLNKEIGTDRNLHRIIKGCEMSLKIESLILHGATPLEAAKTVGCSLSSARRVLNFMRKIARNEARQTSEGISDNGIKIILDHINKGTDYKLISTLFDVGFDSIARIAALYGAGNKQQVRENKNESTN